MAARKTRSGRLRTLEERLAWLRDKRSARKAAGEPWSYLSDEIVALEWALPILREAADVQDAIGESPFAVEKGI